MHKKHTELFEQFLATFHPDTIVSWKKDHSQPNPYLEPSPCRSLIFYSLIYLN
jgi:hypothetical protein